VLSSRLSQRTRTASADALDHRAVTEEAGGHERRFSSRRCRSPPFAGDHAGFSLRTSATQQRFALPGRSAAGRGGGGGHARRGRRPTRTAHSSADRRAAEAKAASAARSAWIGGRRSRSTRGSASASPCASERCFVWSTVQRRVVRGRPRLFARSFATLALRAGVRRRFAPHQLRHAHAVEMAREGVPLNVIQRQLGHANLGITSVYLQGIDNSEIIDIVHARAAPMLPANAGLRRRSSREAGATPSGSGRSRLFAGAEVLLQ